MQKLLYDPELEKAKHLEDRRADRKRADEEKRRRRRIAKQKGNLSSPRLATLWNRLTKLWVWLQPEDGRPDPTDSKKIKQFRRFKRKVRRMIREEERRIGRPALKTQTLAESIREWARGNGRSEEEVLAEYAAKEAAERQCWSDKKKTPEGRAERLKQARFLRGFRWQVLYLELVNPDCRRPKKDTAPAKTMAMSA